MSTSLQIATVLGKEYAMSQEDADQILPTLESAVSQKKSLNLSFLGLDVCTTIFLNNLLGKLYLKFGVSVDDYIHLSGIPKDDLVLPQRVEKLRQRTLNPDIYKPIFDNAFGEA